jgi:hypothetical protein
MLKIGAFLLQGILDLEQIGEVGASLKPHGEIDWLISMVEDRQVLVETVAHLTGPKNGERRVDIDGSGHGNQEELRRLRFRFVAGRLRPRQGAKPTPRLVQNQRRRQDLGESGSPPLSLGGSLLESIG